MRPTAYVVSLVEIDLSSIEGLVALTESEARSISGGEDGPMCRVIEFEEEEVIEAELICVPGNGLNQE